MPELRSVRARQPADEGPPAAPTTAWDVLEARLVTARANDLLREASDGLERLAGEARLPARTTDDVVEAVRAVESAARAVRDARRRLLRVQAAEDTTPSHAQHGGG